MQSCCHCSHATSYCLTIFLQVFDPYFLFYELVWALREGDELVPLDDRQEADFPRQR